MSEHTPFSTIDWNAEWQRHAALLPVDDPATWDRKAAHFGKHSTSRYARDLIAMCDIAPGESVFDMGCGAGGLAIPLALAGHQVTAADFSSGMLGELERRASEAGAPHIATVQMSWNDDWQSCGIDPDSHDIALASRSIGTQDLRDALGKLSAVARRKVCITFSATALPGIDEQLLRALGLEYDCPPIHRYALNVLFQMGYDPELRYIVSSRRDQFDTVEEARATYTAMIEAPALQATPDSRQIARKRLEEWLENELIDTSARSDVRIGSIDEAIEHRYVAAQARPTRWACLLWEV